MSRMRKQKIRERKEEEERIKKINKQRIRVAGIDFRSSVRDLPEGIGKEGEPFLRFITGGKPDERAVENKRKTPYTFTQEGVSTQTDNSAG